MPDEVEVGDTPGEPRRRSTASEVSRSMCEARRVDDDPVLYSSSLPDGSGLIFRPIRPEDKERLVTAFESLSPETRYARFLRPLTRLSSKQVVYLTEVDMKDHYAWVALKADDPGQPGLGVARWIRLREGPGVAEVAVTVVDEYQRQGIGLTLLWLCTLSAIELGVKGFRVWMLGENRAAMNLLRGVAEPHGRWEDGVFVATLPLPRSTGALRSTPPPLPLRPLGPRTHRAF